MDLCAKYRPTSLEDIYGHQHVVNFFKSVLQRPEESPRYYLLQSGFGLGKCVTGDSLINTPSGVRTIRSFFPEEMSDSETALVTNVPYKVEDGFGSEAQSTELYYSGRVPTVTVTTALSSICCTPHHPLYVWDSELGEFGWCCAEFLVPDKHYVMLSSVKSSELNHIDEYWWSLGVLFGAYWWATSTLSTVRGENPDSSFVRYNPDKCLILHKDYVQALTNNLGCSFVDADFLMPGGFPKNSLPLTYVNLKLPAGVHFDDDSLSFLLTRSVTEQVSFLAGYCANNLDISYSPTLVSRVCVQHFQLFQSIALSAGMAIRPYKMKVTGVFEYTAFHTVTEDVDFDLFSWFCRDQPISRSTVSGKGLCFHCPGLSSFLSKPVKRNRLRYKKNLSVRDLHHLAFDPNSLGETYIGMIPSPVLSVVSGGVQECFDLVLPTERHSFVANGIVSHNTTLCRAFAHDLIGDNFMETPNYLEIDSSEKAVVDNFDYFREMMFQEVPGWKVVVMDECLHYNSRLYVRDSKGKVYLRKIGTIVNNHEPFEVLSSDSNGNLAWKKIVGFHKNQAHPLFKLTFKSSGGRTRHLICTDNHPIKDCSGNWVKSGDLEIGQFISGISKNSPFKPYVRCYFPKSKNRVVHDTPESEQVILGTLLGDSSLRKGNHKSKNYRMTYMQGGKQWFYFYEKERIFKAITGSKYVSTLDKFYTVGDYPEHSVLRANTLSLSYFDKYLDLLNQEHRTISREYLDRLSPLGIAVWYMDDGSFSGWKMVGNERVRPTSNSSGYVSLSTHGFGEDGNKIIQTYFQEVWGIQFDLKQDSRCSSDKSWFLRTSDKESTERFCKLVAPYVLTEFQYKLGWYATAGNGLRNVVPLELSFEEREPTVYVKPEVDKSEFLEQTYTLVSKKPYKDIRSNATYDITVEGTNCYYADGILVHNCHLLPQQTSQRLLKILEDFTGRLFLFFATTNPELMFPPLLSRVHKFSLPLFNADQVKEYLSQIATKESLTISDQGLAMLALNSQGHLRDALKSLELVALQGEETYLKSFSPVWVAIQDYFFGDTDPDKMVSSLSAFAPTQLRQYFTYFMRQHVLNPNAKNYGKVYPSHLLPKLFSTWLQLSSKIVSADDFFSLIYVFHPILTSLRSKNG